VLVLEVGQTTISMFSNRGKLSSALREKVGDGVGRDGIEPYELR